MDVGLSTRVGLVHHQFWNEKTRKRPMRPHVNMAKGISVQQSRFALLSIEGSDESDENESKKDKAGTKNGQQSASSKKKRNRKKKDPDAAELRNLAFGGSNKSKGNKGHSAQAKQNGGSGDAKAPDTQWEEWQRLDKEFTSDAYQQDLQQAILQSKLAFEMEKETRGKNKEGIEENGKSSKRKNKKKNTMTLEEFNKKVESQPKPRPPDDVDELGLDVDPVIPPPEPKPQPPPAEPDPEFFKKIDRAADRIIEREKIQDDYKKHYIVENARIQQFKEQITKKDREILMLRTSHEKLQEELKTVKKRNQQLCFIISQGEMKDKKSVLLELEEIKVERDELREQVNSLTTDLEKERTKVHTIKDEMYKLKGSKRRSSESKGK